MVFGLEESVCSAEELRLVSQQTISTLQLLMGNIVDVCLYLILCATFD